MSHFPHCDLKQLLNPLYETSVITQAGINVGSGPPVDVNDWSEVENTDLILSSDIPLTGIRTWLENDD